MIYDNTIVDSLAKQIVQGNEYDKLVDTLKQHGGHSALAKLAMAISDNLAEHPMADCCVSDLYDSQNIPEGK